MIIVLMLKVWNNKSSLFLVKAFDHVYVSLVHETNLTLYEKIELEV